MREYVGNIAVYQAICRIAVKLDMAANHSFLAGSHEVRGSIPLCSTTNVAGRYGDVPASLFYNPKPAKYN